MQPLIGIPPCLDERGRWRAGRTYQYIDVDYARAVEQAGGAPLYLPLQADAEPLAARIEGLLLSGGDDFPPEAPYPEGVRFDPVPTAQAAFDRRLLAAALARGLPVLAICYGMQLLALHHGGSLHYHIPSDVPEAGPHRLPEPDGRHIVRIVPGSRLATALGVAEDMVNSLHHQGVAEPGAGLHVCARSKDGLIEAIERAEPPFCVGVQWHPEKMRGPHRERLFRAFVAASRGV
ncbi:MAG: gamma-glutamyl-gamma-aminobutyrate hydrolase family protein [Deltaproteobacteria bacterium]|nr:gamma-glutamyl-gamma-aminobutyrate hydrolase family protein [Deltaproteobacteria bacterium]